MALYDGTVQDRYDRDWLQLTDTRKQRDFDNRTAERRNRDYVDPDTSTTVGTTGDNNNGTVTLDPA